MQQPVTPAGVAHETASARSAAAAESAVAGPAAELESAATEPAETAAPARLAPVVRISAEPVDIAAVVAALTAGRGDDGAVVMFSVYCRDEDGTLAALEIEHYPGMAEAEIGRIAEAACRRWPLTGLSAVHRHGLIRPGEPIVLVVAGSRHRHAAFEAAGYVMDFLKTSAPFWKKEHRTDGTASDWVAARDADDASRARWE
jgi:molybdopterin synthase catalytic subunit